MRDPPPACRQIPPQLQWIRVVVVTCTTRGSSACHLCKCSKNLHCQQVAVTACTTRGLCLSVLQLKANVNGECKCRTLHERPVASSTCSLPIPKRTCSGCGTIQAIGSLCPTKSMQVSSRVVCSQFHKEFAVDVGCYHLLYDPGPEPPMSVLQLKENFNSECQCHRIYDPWLFSSLLYNSGCSHCMYAPWMYDRLLLRLSPLQLKKYLQCKLVAVHRLLWHCMYDPWALFDCSSVKANINSECTCWSLHVCPWPPSIVSSQTPKRTCSAWRLLSCRTQAMGSLSVCSSAEICGCKCHRMYDALVLRLPSLQLKRILAVQGGDSHCMYHPWPLFSCSSTESNLSSTVKASAKIEVSVVRLSLRVHEKKIAEMSKWWPFFPWFLRFSSSRFSKSAIILSLLHMAPFLAAPVSQCDRRMLDKVSIQATETEESIWPCSKVCEKQRRHSHRP